MGRNNFARTVVFDVSGFDSSVSCAQIAQEFVLYFDNSHDVASVYAGFESARHF